MPQREAGRPHGVWGNWFSVLLLAFLVGGGAIALSFAASPLFAIVIAAIVVGVVLVLAAVRRGASDEQATRSRPRTATAKATGAPVGSKPGDDRPPPASPEGPSRAD